MYRGLPCEALSVRHIPQFSHLSHVLHLPLRTFSFCLAYLVPIFPLYFLLILDSLSPFDAPGHPTCPGTATTFKHKKPPEQNPHLYF